MSSKVLNKTKSLCPVCLKRINADVVLKDGRVMISKRCNAHGKFECFHAWDDPFLYEELLRLSRRQDSFAKDAMLNVTSACNMKCSFCFSSVIQTAYEPKLQDIIATAGTWKNGGILLFGGEPTLRKDLFKVIRQIKALGLNVSLLTNGLKLDKKFVKRLKESGIDKVELQFDSLDDEVNVKMRKMKLLQRKLRAIENLSEAGIPFNLTVCIVKDCNELQIGKIISFVARRPENIATVMVSPISPEGPVNNYNVKFISNDELLKQFEAAGIKKEDFIACTRFDVSLSNFLRKVENVRRINTVPCLMSCHIFVSGSKMTPLNRLIDLDEISRILDEIAESKRRGRVLIACRLFEKFVMSRAKIDIATVPFLVRYAASMIMPSLKRRDIAAANNKIFSIAVQGSYQTRYNIDYNFIKRCNTHIDDKNGSFAPFCENTIFSTGRKRFSSLNRGMIVNHDHTNDCQKSRNCP